jgi:hypothetical protein
LTTCSPRWCRLTPNHAGDTAATTLIHTDGTHRHVVGDAKAIAVDSDVALLDRFELLATTTSGNELVTVSTLALYDLSAGRSVLITQAATNAGGSGTYIW